MAACCSVWTVLTAVSVWSIGAERVWIMGDHLSVRAVLRNWAGALADSIVLRGYEEDRFSLSAQHLNFTLALRSSLRRLCLGRQRFTAMVPLLYASFLHPLSLHLSFPRLTPPIAVGDRIWVSASNNNHKTIRICAYISFVTYNGSWWPLQCWIKSSTS